MDETPKGTRRVPWYKQNINNTWPGEFFAGDEWARIVEVAEAKDKGSHLRLFQEIMGKFWELSETLTEQPVEGEIQDTTGYVQANRLYYEIKLHNSLMEQSASSQKEMERVKEQLEKVRGHFVSKSPDPTHQSKGAGAAGAVAETETRPQDKGQMAGSKFLTAEQVARVSSAFEADEWSEVVTEAVEKNVEDRDRSLRRVCDEFGVLFNEAWEPQMAADLMISPDFFQEGLRLFFKAELYQALLNYAEETAEAFLSVQKGLQQAETHNQKILAQQQQSAVSPEVILKQPTLRPGVTSPLPTAHCPLDKKVQTVLAELEELTMNSSFEPTHPLAEFIRDSVGSGGLLDHEEAALGGILLKFTRERLGILRQAYQAFRPKEAEVDRHGEYLGMLVEWEDNFGQYTVLRTPSRTGSHSSVTAASQGGSVYQTPPNKEPLQHLKRPMERPLGVFSQFVPRATFQPRFTGAYHGSATAHKPPENFEPRFPGRSFTRKSPLAQFVGVEHSGLPEGPPVGVRSSPFRAGASEGPNTQAYRTRARPGTLGEGFGTFTGSVPDQPPANQTAATSGTAAMGSTPGLDNVGNMPDQQMMQMQMLKLMNQVCDKLSRNNSDQGSIKSLTRLKFPDLKVEKFNGEESRFLPWLLSFQELISLDKNLSDIHKVMLLKQHLGEGVKEQLKFTGNQLSYNNAMDILLRKYARPGKVQDEYRRKIQELTGPSSNHDYKGLERTVLECRKCLNALELLGQSAESVDYSVRDKLISLLPPQMDNRFRDFLFAMYGNYYPTELHCTQIMDAMETFAERHKDTKLSKESPGPRSGGGTTQGQNGKKSGGRGAASKQNPPTSQPTTMVTTTDQATKQKWCAMCQVKGDHNTTACRKYETEESRYNRFRELKLCYLCAGPTHDGGVKKCPSTRQCGAKMADSTCRGRHHRALHRAPTRAAGGPPEGGTGAGNTENEGQNRSQSGQAGNGRRRV